MLNIPMPGNPGDAMLKGYDTMSTQMARLLQAKLQREQMAQQQNQFGQSFGLQQAQEDRLAALSPYQQRLLMAQASSAEQEAQQLAQQRQFMQSILGNQMPDVMNNPTAMANPSGGEASQGSAPNYGNMMDNPMLAGFFKKITGVDPYSESPNAKSNRDFQDFTRKEEYKQSKPKDLLTSARVDALQKSVIGIDQVLPMLEELKESNPGIYGGWWSPSNQAKYEGIVSNIIEPLLASKGLTGTVENSHAMRATVERKIGEDFDSWLERIDDEIKIVKRIKKENTQMLSEGKVIPKSHEKKNGIINGRKVTVSLENLESFKDSGGVISD